MAESDTHGDLPQATLAPRKRVRVSVVWIIPLIAAVVALGIAAERILSEGPTIRIVFNSAEGVEAGKTFIKYKDVDIGQVTAVELSKDFSKVIVVAKMAKHVEDLMVEDAKFWVVQARVTLSGISGLGTLLSGNFIGFEAGSSSKPQRRFTGLAEAPVVRIDQPGTEFEIHSDNLGSVGTGSPVYYRRIQVGQVIAYQLAEDGQSVQIKVFINAPYDRFVHPETRFWNASGLDVSVGAGGVDVRTESLVTLLIGGVAFETPAFAPTGERAAADTLFTLYQNRAAAMKQPEAIARRYVLYVRDSLRGLAVGAPVTLLGLPAGEVTEVGIDIDPQTGDLRGRVEVVAYPEALVARLRPDETAVGAALVRGEAAHRSFFQRLIEQGLRAQLRSGSLLTGKLYVAFDFFPDAPKAEIDWSQEVPVLPLIPSTLPDVEAKLTSILAKIDQLPFKEIGASLAATLATLDETLKGVDKAVEHIDAGLTPELQSTIAELRRALATANRVIADTGATLVGRDAPGQLELRSALREVSSAARSVRVLSDYLERHPDALLRGKPGGKP